MVSIYGDVGAFRDLKSKLAQNGMFIQRIEDYREEYSRIEDSLSKVGIIAEKTIQSELLSLEHRYNYDLERLMNIDIEYSESNYIKKIIIRIQIILLKFRLSKRIKEADKIEKNHDKYHKNIQHRIEKKLFSQKHCIESQKHIYHGAIAELEVQKHLQKNKTTSSFVINDFNKPLTKAISMKGGNDWIQTIQIDHLIINKKGVFQIETKNWSKEFEKGEKFTPIYQCRRHGHAFYFSFQKKIESKIGKKIKRYDVVARKQNINFKYHKESHVNEMNIYSLNYFINSKPDILSDSEVMSILQFLK